jgi:hypothetical protein
MDKVTSVAITKAKNEARAKIQYLINTNPEGLYTHNVIAMTLILLAQDHGYRVANELITELDLTNLYGIKLVKEETPGD